MRVEGRQTSQRSHKPIPSDGGLPPTPNLFNELMKGWRGFTQTAEEADEGSNEPKRSPKPMNPKSYVNLSKTT
jgi:hypothetical protein